MNAPARITVAEAASATPVDPAKLAPQREPAWARYIPSIDALRPGCSDEEKRHRAGLMLLRDMSAAGQRTCSWEVAQALSAIEHVAGTHALTSMTVADLNATRLALVRLYTAARDLGKVFRVDG